MRLTSEEQSMLAGDHSRALRKAMEILTSIKRAGADLILTYHAKEAAKII